MTTTLTQAVRSMDPNYKHVLEFGVWKGESISELRKNLDSSYSIFGFDSFEGLPEDWVGTSLQKGFFNVNGKIPDIQGVTFYKGWFVDTIPKYIEIAQPIALLNIDSDLYSSAKQILYGLNKFIVKNTIIVFDEWYYNFYDTEENGQHEQKAFYEWVKDFDIKYELFNYFDPEKRIVKIL